jgi:hypothetical protein
MDPIHKVAAKLFRFGFPVCKGSSAYRIAINKGRGFHFFIQSGIIPTGIIPKGIKFSIN